MNAGTASTVEAVNAVGTNEEVIVAVDVGDSARMRQHVWSLVSGTKLKRSLDRSRVASDPDACLAVNDQNLF
jgi:hypothetical protein